MNTAIEARNTHYQHNYRVNYWYTFLFDNGHNDDNMITIGCNVTCIITCTCHFRICYMCIVYICREQYVLIDVCQTI